MAGASSSSEAWLAGSEAWLAVSASTAAEAQAGEASTLGTQGHGSPGGRALDGAPLALPLPRASAQRQDSGNQTKPPATAEAPVVSGPPADGWAWTGLLLKGTRQWAGRSWPPHSLPVQLRGSFPI